MRKTSQDGGDSTSITSGFENEFKKTSMGIIKTKRSSIKRKVQNFSLESDDTVIEPLLQIDKNEAIDRSAKYLISKSKTESINECESNINLSDSKSEETNVPKSIYPAGAIVTNSNVPKTLHNHMNTNVFGVNGSTNLLTGKSPVLVAIKGSRPLMHSNQTSSIFTTAKISSDSMTKTMEPIQVTPVPIFSTVEVNVTNSGIPSEYQQSKSITSSGTDNINVGDNGNNKNQLSKIQNHNISDSLQTKNNMPDPSEPSTSGCWKKSENISESKSTKKETLTESDSNFLTKSYDLKKSNVIIATVDSETIRKIVPQTQSSVNVTLENKYKAIEENLSTELLRKNTQPQQQNSEVKTFTEVGGNLSKQNISTVKTIIPQEVIITKEGKYTTGSIKQLQRQKNAVLEDSQDLDISHNKNKSDKVVEVKNQLTSSSVIQISKPNINIEQSMVSSNVGTIVEKPSGNVSKFLVTNSKVSSCSTPENVLKSHIEVSQTQSSLVKNDSSDIASKALQAQDSVNLAKTNQISKDKAQKSSKSIVTTGVDFKTTSSVKQLQSMASSKSELMKDSKKITETSKSVKDIPIQVLTSKPHTSATDSYSKSVNSSSTTGVTASLKISPVPTNKQTAPVSSKSCTIQDVKPKSSTNKALGISTVHPADSTPIAKTAVKSKPTTLPSSTEPAVVSKSESSSSAGMSMSISKNTPNTIPCTSVTTSSSTASQKMTTKVSLSDKYLKKN